MCTFIEVCLKKKSSISVSSDEFSQFFSAIYLSKIISVEIFKVFSICVGEEIFLYRENIIIFVDSKNTFQYRLKIN